MFDTTSSNVEATFRDIMRMTTREREELHILVSRLIDTRSELLSAVHNGNIHLLDSLLEEDFDLDEAVAYVTSLKTFRLLLDMPTRIPTEASSFNEFQQSLSTEVDALLDEVYGASEEVENAYVADLEKAKEAEGEIAEGELTAFETAERARLEAIFDRMSRVDDSTSRLIDHVSNGTPLEDDLRVEENIVGYSLEGEPTYLGDRTKETPAVERHDRTSLIEGYELDGNMESEYFAPDDLQREIIRSHHPDKSEAEIESIVQERLYKKQQESMIADFSRVVMESRDTIALWKQRAQLLGQDFEVPEAIVSKINATRRSHTRVVPSAADMRDEEAEAVSLEDLFSGKK